MKCISCNSTTSTIDTYSETYKCDKCGLVFWEKKQLPQEEPYPFGFKEED